MQPKIVKLKKYSGQYMEFQRVIYGKKDCPQFDREYTHTPGGPVGTIRELAEWGHELSLAGAILIDKIEGDIRLLTFKTMKVIQLNNYYQLVKK